HGWVQVWDTEGDTLKPLWTFDKPHNCYCAVAFSPDGQMLTAASGVSVRVWRPEADPQGPVVARKLFCLWAGGALGSGFVLLLLARLRWRAPGPGRRVRDWALVATLAGAALAVAGWQAVDWWGPTLFKLHRELSAPGEVTALAFSADGQLPVVADKAGHVTRWEVGVHHVERISTSEKLPAVQALAITPDG